MSAHAAIRPVRTGYDVYVRCMRIALPAAAIALAGVMLFWPLLSSEERSFVLNEETMRRGGETIRIVAPSYRGTDDRGRLFTVSAERAVQESPDDASVTLEGIEAFMELGGGRSASVEAEGGVYDTDAETVRVPGEMTLTTSDGYRLEGRNARVDLADKMVISEEPVTGRGPLGEIRADRFTLDIDGRKAVFEGNLRMRTTPETGP